jgi:tellurite resistance protein
VGLGTPDVGRVQDMVMATQSLSSALRRLKSQKTRRLLVQQAVALAWVDGRYDEAERAAVRSISGDLGVPEGWLEDVEKWAAEGHAWQQRGKALIDA